MNTTKAKAEADYRRRTANDARAARACRARGRALALAPADARAVAAVARAYNALASAYPQLSHLPVPTRNFRNFRLARPIPQSNRLKRKGEAKSTKQNEQRN